MVELLLVGRTGGVRRKEGLIMAEYTLPDLDYDYGALGGFNWSSQHLDFGGVRWRRRIGLRR
ncbi:hypothetical protein, partial [Brachybacterium paraconglomeratum]|uniref:hypothetical protein n=1 Tax=Brachybacterium paraconglomeratum TaxID=173362 RepID=UPI0022AEE4DD